MHVAGGLDQRIQNSLRDILFDEIVRALPRTHGAREIAPICDRDVESLQGKVPGVSEEHKRVRPEGPHSRLGP